MMHADVSQSASSTSAPRPISTGLYPSLTGFHFLKRHMFYTRLPLRTQVYFYHQGRVVHQISGIRGEVLPAFSVSGGAILEANFGGAEYAQVTCTAELGWLGT